MSRKAFRDVKAYVFDAYGTLFDIGSAAQRLKKELGRKAKPLSDLWRSKQLEYTWLRSLMGCHADFWRVTGDALDYALESHGIEDTALRRRLMNTYLELGAYDDVREALTRLKAAKRRTAILSNGSPKMIETVVQKSGLGPLLDEVLSVEEVAIYKPHPMVYRLAVEHLNAAPDEIAFFSSNPWDVAGAKRFGFRVAWVNRFGQTRERLPDKADAEIKSLAELPKLLGI